MNAVVASALETNFQIITADLPHLLEKYQNTIQVLSLDCFDTLLWRMTTQPREVFHMMQQRPLCQSLGVTAYQRLNAAARAYRKKLITHQHQQITLAEIYAQFTNLTKEQQAALIEEEIQCEIEMCYAFSPMINFLLAAAKLGIKIILVSDIYLTEPQLRRLITAAFPKEAMAAISKIYCSCEYQTSKSENLFSIVLQDLKLAPNSILHIGDHPTADYQSAKRHSMQALHFLQFHPTLDNFLKIQHNASSLTALSNTNLPYKRSPRYNPYRAIFSEKQIQAESAEHTIGYLTFGPMLFAFAHFINEEINALIRAGKKPKVFFLLRDAYLLSRACEVFAGKPLGKLVRIRKFVAVAASFKTQDDVDHYLSSISSQHFNMAVICEQLLLPKETMERLIQLAYSSESPQKKFYQLLHNPAILDVIFTNSTAYRNRLRKYVQKEMGFEPGDTVVLVDTGYIGVTQEFFARTFQDEFNIEIIGRYFISSHEPDRPICKSLLNSSWCEHGLFEQSATLKEGCVIDYTEEGEPVFDTIKLTDEQYGKVALLQKECLRFIHDAKSFYQQATPPSFTVLQETAMAVLKRHIFFPTENEIAYFKVYQHDKDLGINNTKRMFNCSQSEIVIRQNTTHQKLHPFENRSINLHFTFSELLQRGFDVDLAALDMSYTKELVQVLFLHTDNTTVPLQTKAIATHDGFFLLRTPIVRHEKVAILFGEKYQWLQIDCIRLGGEKVPVSFTQQKNIIFTELTNRGGNLFECLSTSSLLLLASNATPDHCYYYEIIFRPVIRR